jgi:hypothetical protein
MRIRGKFIQFIALSLAVLIGVGTVPVSAAEVAAPANIGSVSAVGSVQLRGVGISEGTLFSGDRVSVAPGAYAKVVLGAGHKVELDGKSNVTISKEADIINIRMTSGNIGFTGGQKPVRVHVGAFEITASAQARGTVAFVGSEAVGVRAIDGTVSVRNTATKQSYTVAEGTERLISLQDSNPAGVLVASAVPTAIPAAPAMPAARQTSGGKKKALLIGAVLGTTAAIAVLMTKNDDSDVDAAARARLQRQPLTQALAGASATAQQASSAATQISTVATTLETAIANSSAPAAKKAELAAAAKALISKSQATRQQIAGLEEQLEELQSRLPGISDRETLIALTNQINAVIDSLNEEVVDLNAQIEQLNAVLNQARNEGVAGVPPIVIQHIPGAPNASPIFP